MVPNWMLVHVAIGPFALRSPNGLRSTPPVAPPGVPSEMWKKHLRLYGSVSAQAIHIVCSNETTLEIENILYHWMFKSFLSHTFTSDHNIFKQHYDTNTQEGEFQKDRI